MVVLWSVRPRRFLPVSSRCGWRTCSLQSPESRTPTCRANGARRAARRRSSSTSDPDETDTLAHIPRELLFPAPRMPRGHVRDRLRRARPLPDADRRRVLDLRAPSAHVSYLRLPSVPGGRYRTRRQAADRRSRQDSGRSITPTTEVELCTRRSAQRRNSHENERTTLRMRQNWRCVPSRQWESSSASDVTYGG